MNALRANDLRLVLPVAFAWAALAITSAQPAAFAPATCAAFAIALSVWLLAKRWRHPAAPVVVVACALTGLLLAAAAGRVDTTDIASCTGFDLSLVSQPTPPTDVVIERAICQDGRAVLANTPAVLISVEPTLPSDAAFGDTWSMTCDAWVFGRADNWMLACTDPVLVHQPWWSAWSGQLRSRFLDIASMLPGDGGALVPGLALGDTSRVSGLLDASMQAAGLTHLTAVSGANCAIVVGAAYGLAVAARLGRTWRVVCAVVALAAFVVLVTPEPSVVRAATMAALALVGLWSGVPGRGIALIALAVLVCLVLDPSLATSAGFALSALATCGLVVHARPITEVLQRLLPLPISGAIAIPLAAQLWCMPVLVALDGVVRPVSIVANVLAAPAAPFATIAGVVACVLAPIAPSVALAVAWVAWAPAAWIAGLAGTAAGLPLASLPWPAGVVGIIAAVAILGSVIVGHAVRRLFRGMVAAALVMIVAMIGAAVPTLALRASIPAWLVAQCDVGQGSATLIRGHPGGSVTLVDTGRDPAVLSECLALFGVTQIDVLVLTHFDVDHTGGAEAVLGRVGTVLHGPADDDGVSLLDRLRGGGAVIRQVEAGMEVTPSGLVIDVLWPLPNAPPGNAASVVLDARWPSGFGMVLLGDLDAESQRALMAGDVSDTSVVVVAHHGSADQEPALYDDIDAELALVPVGENSYGHPAAGVLTALAAGGATVLRTDVVGAVAIAPGPQDGSDAEVSVEVWVERPP